MSKLNKLAVKKEESVADAIPLKPEPDQIAQYGATAGGWAQADIIRLPEKEPDSEK